MIGSAPDPSGAPGSLPYRDTKPQGAADFYFATNATFRFIRNKLGGDGLRRYWRELGERYYAPVTKLWAAGGLASVADYWRDFFAAEPGSEVEISTGSDEVVLDVRRCPAIAHLRLHNRGIVPEFCEHCYYVSEAIGARAGIAVRIQGGNGTCRQIFSKMPGIPGRISVLSKEKMGGPSPAQGGSGQDARAPLVAQIAPGIPAQNLAEIARCT